MFNLLNRLKEKNIIDDFYVEKVHGNVQLDIDLSYNDYTNPDRDDIDFMDQAYFVRKGYEFDNVFINLCRFLNFDLVDDSNVNFLNGWDDEDFTTTIRIEYYFSMDCSNAQELLKRFNEKEFGDKR